MSEEQKIGKRRIIQITPAAKSMHYRLYCLCDDGTVWGLDKGHSRNWSYIASSPQEDINE